MDSVLFCGLKDPLVILWAVLNQAHELLLISLPSLWLKMSYKVRSGTPTLPGIRSLQRQRPYLSTTLSYKLTCSAWDTKVKDSKVTKHPMGKVEPLGCLCSCAFKLGMRRCPLYQDAQSFLAQCRTRGRSTLFSRPVSIQSIKSVKNVK